MTASLSTDNQNTTRSNSNDVYIFAKDRQGRFLFCNDPFAEVIGVDSPAAVIGKTDLDTCWRDYIDIYRAGDLAVMSGKKWRNVWEKQLQSDEVVHDIVVSKHQLLDKNGAVKGVIGSYIKKTPIVVSNGVK